MGLILNLVPNKKKLHLSMKIGATRLSNCKVGKLLCNFQSSKSLQTKGKPAGVKQHQPQLVFAKISYGETLPATAVQNVRGLFWRLHSCGVATRCLLLLWNTGFPSVICHLWFLGWLSRLDKGKIIPVAFWWLDAILALSCTTFSQSSWPKSSFEESDSLSCTTRWTPQAKSSPYHHGKTNTVWEINFQNRYFEVVETTGTNQVLKYSHLGFVWNKSTSCWALSLLHSNFCFCLLCAVILFFFSHPPHSIKFLRNITACMLQISTSVLV